MKKVLLLLLFCLPVSFNSYAQLLYGLDPTFANNGIYMGDTGGYTRLVVQPDNKIIVTGAEVENTTYMYIVRRLNEDGTKDASFANNGCFKISALGLNNTIVTLLYLQPDGKVLLGGSADTGITNQDFLLIRLKQDGNLDSSFGGGGYVMTSYINTLTSAISDAMSSITLQPDGKIIAYGSTKFLSDTLQVIRYHPDGRVDSSFGVNGIVRLAEGFEYPTPNDIALMPDGRIVVGVKARISSLNPPWGTYAFTAIRLLSDGSLDTSFNHKGMAYTNKNLGGLLYCKAMCLQPDGKILLAGHGDSLAVIRFDVTGTLDYSFGKIGIAKIDYGDTHTLELQQDGKILLGGKNDTNAIIYRLLSNGNIDNDFGMNGVISTSLLTAFSDIVIQPDYKLLSCGYNVINPQGSFNYSKPFIARFMPDAANSVMNLFLDGNLTVFPNPATDYINIDVPTSQNPLHIALYSIDGKLLRTQTHPGTNRLSTYGLADGIYYLHIRFANHATLVKKIIIQKH